MELKLNDKYKIPRLSADTPGFQIQITKLGTSVSFLVSGNDEIENPDKPRDMPTIAFVRWLQKVRAIRVK